VPLPCPAGSEAPDASITPAAAGSADAAVGARAASGNCPESPAAIATAAALLVAHHHHQHQQQQQQQMGPPLAPGLAGSAAGGSSVATLQHSVSVSSTDSSSIIVKGYRRSGSMEQGSPMQQRISKDSSGAFAGMMFAHQNSSPMPGGAGVAAGVADQNLPAESGVAGQQLAGKPPQQPGRRSNPGSNPPGQQPSPNALRSLGSGTASQTSLGSNSSLDGGLRASFCRDGLGEPDDWRRGASLEAEGSRSNPGPTGSHQKQQQTSGLKLEQLQQHNLLLQQQQPQQDAHQLQPADSSSGAGSAGSKKQQRQGYHRASAESCASGRSGRSSFTAEIEAPEVDQYGRPSFAAFEAMDKALAGRGEA